MYRDYSCSRTCNVCIYLLGHERRESCSEHRYPWVPFATHFADLISNMLAFPVAISPYHDLLCTSSFGAEIALNFRVILWILGRKSEMLAYALILMVISLTTLFTLLIGASKRAIGGQFFQPYCMGKSDSNKCPRTLVTVIWTSWLLLSLYWKS